MRGITTGASAALMELSIGVVSPFLPGVVSPGPVGGGSGGGGGTGGVSFPLSVSKSGSGLTGRGGGLDALELLVVIIWAMHLASSGLTSQEKGW